MTGKKMLTEEQLKELSEDQLNKISGGVQTGDICPVCNTGVLTYDRNTGCYECSVCSFVYNPKSF